MNKFQKVDFNSISDFLDYLPEEQLLIVEVLRDLVIEYLPECEEKLAYNVPFYYGNSRICYIWPSAIPWGGINEGVALGICNANLLENHLDKLQFSNKQTVAHLSFNRIEEIDLAVTTELLKEALKIDKEIGTVK